nr:hypothetical protein HUO10_003322 [Paraburkholderia busanensis]
MPMPVRMALFVDVKAYRSFLRQLKYEAHDEFVPKDANACCHYFVNDVSGFETVAVCIDREKMNGKHPIEVACQIVHEAVHVFQECVEYIGEKNVGREFEAYSIQHISEQLMKSYAEQTS